MNNERPDLIIKGYFLEHGKSAPKNSEMKGVVSHETMFGSGKSFMNYTNRKDAVKDSVLKDTSGGIASPEQKNDWGNYSHEENLGSFAGYTSRENATKNSINEGKYFTMSSSGKLFTEEDRENFRNDVQNVFTQEGNIAWELVVSLQDYPTLDKYHLKDQNDLSAIVSNSLLSVFQRLGFDSSNMVWWEDYHTNTSHPHMHITFMEREQTRTRGKLTAKELDMVKSVIVSEMGARTRYLEQYGETSEQALIQLGTLKKQVVQDVKNMDYQTIQQVIDLYSKLPKNGRLQYNSIHIKPFRQELDTIVDSILKTDEIKQDYLAFLEKGMTLTDNIKDMVNSNVSTLLESEDNKLRIQIANAILKGYKDYKESNDPDIKEIRKTIDWKEQQSINLLKTSASEILAMPTASMEEKIACAAIIANDTETAMKALDDILPDCVNKAFLMNAAILIDEKSSEEEKVAARTALNLDAKENKKSTVSKHYSNFVNKGYELNKRTKNGFTRFFSPYINREAKRAIKQQDRELEDEINQYLHNSNTNSPMNYNEYLKLFGERKYST